MSAVVSFFFFFFKQKTAYEMLRSLVGSEMCIRDSPRVTLIAQHAGGWAALCRLVSATHLAGERGRPVCSSDLIAEHAAAGGVFVLLGPDSDVGRALAVRRPDLARGHLDRWRAVVAQTDLVVELVSHRGRC